MSTLPGLASKGEKEKGPKYQSLDINRLYRFSLGENLDNKPQKSVLSQKHGMQSLGKVPNTRRPPANLPSLKSEHSGTDTAVSLVPSNGSGWGNKETTVQPSTTTPTTIQQTTNNVNANVPVAIGPPQLTAHQAAIALPVTTTVQPANKAAHPTSANPVTNLDKSWSSVIGSDPNAAHPPLYQSPQFQHEFPSLSAGDGAPPRAGTDTQYVPGLSLRPQTEGSWLQGGGARADAGGGGARGVANSAVPGLPLQHSGPGGPPVQAPAAPIRGFVPTFMYRGSGYPNGHGAMPPSGPVLPPPPPLGGGPGLRRPDPRHRNPDLEELVPRPIIKEEELIRMDNLTGDMGWAVNDDIDYNQKLAFSDDELKADKDTRKPTRTAKDSDKTDTHSQDTDVKPSWSNKSQPRVRHEDDEFQAQRRRQQLEIAHAVERAKQRKEEEEKKFLETKQAAAKKLQELDERIGKSKRDKDNDDSGAGASNPDAVLSLTIASVPILFPEWEREKDARAKTSVAGQQHHHDNDDVVVLKHKPGGHRETDFKHLTQIEGRATFRKDARSVDKEPQPASGTGGAGTGGGAGGGTNAHSFSKQFQNDLPPRFQKQQQLNAQSTFQYENRWASAGGTRTSPSNRKSREEEKDLEDRYGRRTDDRSDYRSSHRPYADSGRKSSDSRYEDHGKERDDEKLRERIRDRHDKGDPVDGVAISRQSSDEWHGDKRIEKYDRPQRPDSRDSRTSRESRHSGDSTRHSDIRGWYSSWAEEPVEEKKKEHRMVVPGPITKEKMEADDLRSEKRNLTQLKRGMLEKKLDKMEKTEGEVEARIIMKKDIDEPKAWADSIPPAVEKELLKPKEEKRDEEDDKKEKLVDKEEKKHHGGGGGRARTDSQGSRNQGWSGSGQVYRNSWSSSKKAPAPSRPPRGSTRTLSKGHDMTESEGSADDAAISTENGPCSKASKKLDKDERNKETRSAEKQPVGDRAKLDKNNFIPRGEPSRLGRGAACAAGSFRGSRGGSKRIDAYGPPAKSPFSNFDEKDKKHEDSEEEKSKSQMKDMKPDDKNRKKLDTRKSKPKQDGDVSDNSDVDGRKSKNSQRPSVQQSMGSRRGGNAVPPRQAPPAAEKRGFGGPRGELSHRHGAPSSAQQRSVVGKDKDVKEKDANALSSAIADIPLKEADILDNDGVVDDGFQEVKSKKTERKVEKPKEESKHKVFAKPEKELLKKPRDERNPKGVNQILPPQVASIPSLMATPVNPPPNMPQSQSAKGQFDRNRQNKTLPPRFIKAKEHNRMQKAQMQQGVCDDNIGKVNSNIYGLKEGLHGVVTSMNSNAWDKPLSSQLRVVDQDLVAVGMDACKSLESTLHHPNPSDDKAVLDGSKPLNTIIFENTNYKSAPGPRGRNDKQRCNKMEEGMDSLASFNKPIGELLVKDKAADIQIQLFNKEDTADMKLDFLESEITQITEEKTSKMSLSRSNMGTSNNILTADALNMKIQSVKKVWESNIPNVMEHTNDDSFPTSFVADTNAMDANAAYSKGSEVADENHDVYSSANANASNSTTNVCKVKPTQQVAGGGGQTLLNAGTHQPHSNIVGPAMMGHALSSPPPIQPVMGGLGQPPQQYTASQHISYQAGLNTNQYGGIPAASPPTVLNYPTQQLQQTGLYASFQIDQQVMNNPGRSQYSQYFGLGQNGSSPYSQSMYLQGQPHAPPNPQPDIYQNMNSYRLPNTGPFGQNQQLNNSATVLISSTSNSLMSPSVKPSNQQISAIGTKAGGVGQAYQQQSQQGQQMFIPFDPSITANYMQSAGVLQRGPGGPVQNNVVPGLQPSGLQPSSSFYSGSTAGQTGYFQAPGSSNLPSQMPQHQTGFGLQQSVFPTHNQSHTNAGMQNFPAPYLSGQIQLAAAAMSQYRSGNMPNSQYMKGQIADQGRQQLKSPGSQQQQELSSVFNSGSQIASPKSRQQMKQPPPQPSPTAQHNKYLYSGISNQQGGGQTRYPAPIQRPAGNYQSQISSNNVSNSGNANPKSHRMNSSNRSSGGRQYYGPQGGNMNTQSEKAEESKLSDSVNSSNQASNGSSASLSAKPPASVNQTGDKTDAKEENCAKD